MRNSVLVVIAVALAFSAGCGASSASGFGDARLDTDLSSYSGLKKVSTQGADSWYVPSVKALGTIPLTRLTYKFHGTRLDNIGFEAEDRPSCLAILDKLKAIHGRPETHPNMMGTPSYDWSGTGHQLVFNDFGAKCSGILWSTRTD